MNSSMLVGEPYGMFLLCLNYSRVDTDPRNLCRVPIKGDPITRQQVFFILNAIMGIHTIIDTRSRVSLMCRTAGC